MERTGTKLTTQPCSSPGHCLLVEKDGDNISFSMQMSIERAERIADCWNAFEKDGLVNELLAILKEPIPESLIPEAWEKAKTIIAEAKEGVE